MKISSPVDSGKLDQLERKIGYCFDDRQLLNQALSHKSYSVVNNERLEFLGDSILNFIVGENLYLGYPTEPEGNLSRLRSYGVRQQSLYEVGIKLSLNDFILLGQGELRSGGHSRQSLIADCVEALIAAVYLDSQSIETCRACILDWFTEKLESLATMEHLKDPKTRLQECMQSKHLPLPVYTIVSIEGSGHDQIFEVSCQTELFRREVTGTGPSKRKAEQAAARTALSIIDDMDEQGRC